MNNLMKSCFVMSLFFLSGCGGGVDEVAPLTTPGQDPPAEKQKDWQEESRKRSGMPAGKMPASK